MAASIAILLEELFLGWTDSSHYGGAKREVYQTKTHILIREGPDGTQQKKHGSQAPAGLSDVRGALLTHVTGQERLQASGPIEAAAKEQLQFQAKTR